MNSILIHTDTRYPVNRKHVRRAVDDTLKKFKMESGNFEVSLAVVGSRKMKTICEKYLNDGQKHEILSFPFEEISQQRFGTGQAAHQNSAGQGFVNPPDGVLRLGDIILCWPYVVARAAEDEMMVDDKIYDLICHGVEHLIGKHHE